MSLFTLTKIHKGISTNDFGASLLFKKMNLGEFKHEVRQFQKPYDNQQAEQISLMV